MRANEFVIERKNYKRKSRGAAYGPGPYAGYGYYAGYSGDSGAGGDGGGESIKNEDAMMGKIADSGKIIRILKKAHTVPFSDEKNWLLVDMDPAKGNKGLGIKWIPADTRFEWVRPYRDSIDENFADDAAEAYRAHLIKTLPKMMKLFANIGKGWIPSKEQMLNAVDTAYQVMKHTGDAKQAGKVLMDELNALYRMSKGKQDVAEGKVINTYLWHGSRQKIPMLEPRQSVDTGGAAGSNQNAIYATSDPKVAIAMGLTTPGSDTGMFPNDPQMVLFSGKIRKGENVYLHKLPMNGPDGKPQFVQGGNSREFHSIPGVEGIKPIEIKEIPVNKYLNLIRKATPADLKLRKKYMKQQDVAENFADGKNPEDKGDAKRHGVNTKGSVSSLRKTAKQGGRKGQLAHWMANMKAGQAKKK